MKKIIVTGAQFTNKGAQSLLFSFVSNIRQYFPDCRIIYFPQDIEYPYENENLKIDVVCNDSCSHQYEAGGISRIFGVLKYVLKKIMKRKNICSDIRGLSKSLKNADLMVDISGYNLGSDWSISVNNNYLRYLSEAEKHKIPIVLFPQSFGPFDYGHEQEKMDKCILEVLPKVSVIYARERDGYDLLTLKYGLKNVRLANDFVLQSPEPVYERIYFGSNCNLKFKKLEKPGYVGIIPNFQNFIHGDADNVLKIYNVIISTLLSHNKNVVIFKHSNDSIVCEKIYDMYRSSDKVTFYDYDFSNYEFSEYIKDFDFLVAARYHAIVHAYKEKIPVIVLGWSTKYWELTKLFNQENFVINTKDMCNQLKINEMVNKMCFDWGNEKKIIEKALINVQSDECIETVVNLLRD